MDSSLIDQSMAVDSSSLDRDGGRAATGYSRWGAVFAISVQPQSWSVGVG